MNMKEIYSQSYRMEEIEQKKYVGCCGVTSSGYVLHGV